jgi:hypothetical protein
MAAAQIRVDLPKFDDKTGGTIAARAFIAAADNAQVAGNINGARMAALVKGHLLGDAKEWLDTQVALGTNGLDDWDTLRPLFQAQFSRNMTMAELAALQRTLDHKTGEKTATFFVRCQRFHIEEDMGLPDATRAHAMYLAEFNRRVKMTFMKGLRPDIRLAMTGVDVNAATGPELLEAAKRAETLLMKDVKAPTAVASVQAPTAQDNVQQQVTAILAANPGLSQEGQAMISAMASFNAFGRGGNRGGNNGRGGNGRGRGGGRGRGRGGQARGGNNGNNSNGTKTEKPKSWCKYHNKEVFHKENECYQKPGNFNPFASTQSNRNAAVQHAQGGQPSQMFQVFESDF